MIALICRKESAHTRATLRRLNRPDVGSYGVGILAVEAKHRHVFMAGQQALADSLGELAEVNLIAKGSKTRCGWMRAVSGSADRMAAGAHAARENFAAFPIGLGPRRQRQDHRQQ